MLPDGTAGRDFSARRDLKRAWSAAIDRPLGATPKGESLAGRKAPRGQQVLDGLSGVRVGTSKASNTASFENGA